MSFFRFLFISASIVFMLIDKVAAQQQQCLLVTKVEIVLDGPAEPSPDNSCYLANGVCTAPRGYQPCCPEESCPSSGTMCYNPNAQDPLKPGVSCKPAHEGVPSCTMCECTRTVCMAAPWISCYFGGPSGCWRGPAIIGCAACPGWGGVVAAGANTGDIGSAAGAGSGAGAGNGDISVVTGSGAGSGGGSGAGTSGDGTSGTVSPSTNTGSSGPTDTSGDSTGGDSGTNSGNTSTTTGSTSITTTTTGGSGTSGSGTTGGSTDGTTSGTSGSGPGSDTTSSGSTSGSTTGGSATETTTGTASGSGTTSTTGSSNTGSGTTDSGTTGSGVTGSGDTTGFPNSNTGDPTTTASTTGESSTGGSGSTVTSSTGGDTTSGTASGTSDTTSGSTTTGSGTSGTTDTTGPTSSGSASTGDSTTDSTSTGDSGTGGSGTGGSGTGGSTTGSSTTTTTGGGSGSTTGGDPSSQMFPDDQPLVIFTTREYFRGNLDGLAGATILCRKAAASANLDGTWYPILASSAWDARNITGIASLSAPIYNTGGELIAPNKRALWLNVLNNPPRFDQFGVKIDGGPAFTGIGTNGLRRSVLPIDSCDDWQTTSPIATSSVGSPTKQDSSWYNSGKSQCDDMKHIYCIGDATRPPTNPDSSGGTTTGGSTSTGGSGTTGSGSSGSGTTGSSTGTTNGTTGGSGSTGGASATTGGSSTTTASTTSGTTSGPTSGTTTGNSTGTTTGGSVTSGTTSGTSPSTTGSTTTGSSILPPTNPTGGTPANNPITLVLEGVYDNGDQTYTAYFSYSNSTTNEIKIPIGNNGSTVNTIAGGSEIIGHPTTFKSGINRGVVRINLKSDQTVTWTVAPNDTKSVSVSATSSSPKLARLTPLYECNNDSVAILGYLNSNEFDIYLPVGNSNGFIPGAVDRSQPNRFFSGLNKGAFYVPAEEGLTWRLSGTSVTVSKTKPSCACPETSNKVVRDGVLSLAEDLFAVGYETSTKLKRASGARMSHRDPQIRNRSKVLLARAQGRWAQLLAELRSLLDKGLPSVTLSCPVAPMGCTTVDDGYLIQQIRERYYRALIMIRRQAARAGMLESSDTRKYQTISTRASSCAAKAFDSLNTVQRFRTDCSKLSSKPIVTQSLLPAGAGGSN